MYRMLIVDDNNRDRRIIQEVIDWSSLGIEVIGEAVDGGEALGLVHTQSPHIILTDVAMPVMNGIELARAVKSEFPGIKIIFMSFYDDFEFAKSAVNMSIYGYVLKPIIPDELRSTVCKVLEIYEQERSVEEEKKEMARQLEESLPALQTEFFKELLFGRFREEQDIWERIGFLRIPIKGFTGARVFSVQISEEDAVRKGKGIKDRYLLAYSVKEMITSMSDSVHRLFALQNSLTEFTVLLFAMGDALQEDGSMEIAISLHTRINENLGLNAIIGISNPSQSIAELPALFNQSISALQTKFYSYGNPIILYKEIEEKKSVGFEDKVNLEELYRKIKELVFSDGEEDVEAFVDSYLGLGGHFPDEAYLRGFAFSVINMLQINLIETEQSFRDVLGDDLIVWKKLNAFDTIMDLRQWLVNIMKTVRYHMQSRNTSRDSQIVNDIKDIIRKRFHEQLTVNDIADAIYLSSKQANNIFRKETGKTIFDYLVEYRIDMAKQLLKDPYSKIYLVAEQVGYVNKSHFCLLFKKSTGLTPAEYKNHPTP